MSTQTQIDRLHGQNTQSRRCTAARADASRCRAWAVHGTDPPRCAPHGGGRAPVGAPLGNQNARTHGFYAGTALAACSDGLPTDQWPDECTIDAVIADLYIVQYRHPAPPIWCLNSRTPLVTLRAFLSRPTSVSTRVGAPRQALQQLKIHPLLDTEAPVGTMPRRH